MSRKKYIALCIISLAVGGLYYLLFKNNTILENIVCKFVDIMPVKSKMPHISSTFFQCHFNDMLWAFSLQCGLCAIFIPTEKQKVYISFAVVFLGFFWEVAQYSDIVNGTGDVLDIAMYFTGSLIAFLFTLNKGE